MITIEPESPTFVLIPGAGGQAWYWHRLVDELRQRGHQAVAVDLPTGDEAAGLAEYAAAALAALPDGPLVVVAQSMGAFTAPLVCEATAVELLILVNAMVPAPGESAGDWWEHTQHGRARQQQAAASGRSLETEDMMADVFFHDVPPDVTALAMAMGEPRQADRPFNEPWPLPHWPAVPTRAVVGSDDRLFPAEFQRRVLHDRLGITPDEIPGGHLVALSRPSELADRLEQYVADLATGDQPETSAR